MLKKGNEYLEKETGIIFKVYLISKHNEYVLVSSRRLAEDFVLNTNPKKIEEIERLIEQKKWVPNTPAARTLYGKSN